MADKELSIIVPVYNGEKYIERCIDTLEMIKGIDFELIIIDDCSKDNTFAMVLERARHYKNIVALRNDKNRGPSYSRNLGIDKAKGRFITFADADDKICSEMYERLVRVIKEKSCDVAMCDFYEVFPGKKKTIVQSKYEYKDEVIEGDIILDRFLTDKISNAVWDKVFKRDTIGKIRFDDNLLVGEDILFCLQVFIRTRSLYTLKRSFYGYRQNDGSIMHQNCERFYQYFEVIKRLDDSDRLILEEKHDKEFDFFKQEMRVRAFHAISMAGSINDEKKRCVQMLKKVMPRTEALKISKNKTFAKSIRVEMWIFTRFGAAFHLRILPVYKFLRSVIR